MNSIKVAGCFQCPMANKFSWCNHPETQGKGIGDEFVPVHVPYPDWCPLIKQPITIYIKQDNNG